MLADLAYLFHWPPSELDSLAAEDLHTWHAQGERITRELSRKP